MITIFIYHVMYKLFETLSSYEETERKKAVFHYRPELKFYLTNIISQQVNVLSAGVETDLLTCEYKPEFVVNWCKYC